MTGARARSGRRSQRGAEVAAWGWYAIIVFPEPKAGGSYEGIVARDGKPRAFWAAWWTGDPRLAAHPPDPDDYGFITGEKPLDQAVGGAYDALRTGRGQRVFDVCIGEEWAIRAYREGAPVKRSTHTDFEELAKASLNEFGLSENASPAEVKGAWRAFVKRAHPDQGGAPVDMEEKKKAYEAVLARAERIEATRQREAISAGAVVVDDRKFIATVRKIARRVREAALDLLGPLSVFGHDGETLSGYCTLAAIGLVRALREANILAQIGAGTCSGAAHWWADAFASPGGTPVIADITATQFWKGAEVVVAAPGSVRARRYNARSRDMGQEELLRVPVFKNIAVLHDGLPAYWWRGGTTMTDLERSALAARANEARGLMGPELGELLKRH